MQTSKIFSLLIISSLLFLISCSDDDSPTTPAEPQQVFLADTTAHLATDVLTHHGGAGWDWGASVVQLPDNGLAIAGSTDSYGSGKNTLYLVKTDATGQVLWDKIFGGTGEDNAESIALTADNNLIVAGVTSSFTGGYDFYLLKVSLDGYLIWQKSIGTDNPEWGTDLVVLSDGYAVCGYKGPFTDDNNVALARTDLNGNTLWFKTYERPHHENCRGIIATNDGGFLLAGREHDLGTSDIDVYLIKTDDTGGVIWEYTYGGDGDDQALAVIEASDGGYVVAGSSRSFGSANYQMVYVLKVDADGTLIWEESFTDSSYCYAESIVENPDGTFILTGNTSSDSTGTGMAKLDASGNLLWTEDIGLYGNGLSIIRDSNGKYVVTGFANDTTITGEPNVLIMRVTER